MPSNPFPDIKENFLAEGKKIPMPVSEMMDVAARDLWSLRNGVAAAVVALGVLAGVTADSRNGTIGNESFGKSRAEGFQAER